MFFMPSWSAFAFIFAMKDFVRADVVLPVPTASASAYAASQPEGSISPYSSWRRLSLSPVLKSAVLPPHLAT